MNIQPLYDRVVVERIQEEKISAGGIFIPDVATEKPIRGVVIAAGPGKVLSNGQSASMTIKVGDKVIFGKYSGTEVKIEGRELIIMREDDIMCVTE